MSMKLKWDRRFLAIAEHIASWSKDPSTKVGCVIVDHKRRFVSAGFNGIPMGVEDSEDRLNNRAIKLEIVIHAEENALLTARGAVDGCTAYLWPMPPCSRCAAKLIQAGITRIVSQAPTREQIDRWGAVWEFASQMYLEAGVDHVTLDDSCEVHNDINS